MKKRSFLLFLCFTVLCLLFFSGPASATVLLNEPFNYLDTAALNDAWNANTLYTPSTTYLLDTGFGNGDQYSYKMPSPPSSAANNRVARNLGADYNGSDAQPLQFSFDLYLSSDGTATKWNGARDYIELRGYAANYYNGTTGLQNNVAIGLNNLSDDGQFSNTYFQTRVYAGASNWYTLNANAGTPGRSAGWHTLMAQIKTSTIDFYIDGILAETISRPNAYGFDCVMLGSGVTANGWTVWADNVKVETVPEPATLLVLGLGSLILRRRG
jgi:hypothetical protein